MTPGARVQAAIELLDEIRSGVPAERAITGWSRRSRFAGSKDRAAVRDHVFQALRAMRSFAHLGGAATGRGIMIGALRAEGADPATFFSGVGHAPAPLDDAEITAGHPPRELGAQMDLPDWMIPHFIASLGGTAEAMQAAQTLRHRAPAMLRANLRKTSPSMAIAALAKENVSAKLVPGLQAGLVLDDGARRFAMTSAYREGLVELQDGSSQAAMEMLEILPGARVLDYCAGGGGKVLALAGRADAKWFAHDALPQRMKDLPERAARAGVRVEILSTTRAHQQTFNVVLCDVPCSGSGTWRRSPDAKWRLTPDEFDSLQQTQDRILTAAADLVTEGGILVYATCSVFREENEDRIAGFISRHPAWKIRAQNRWPISDIGDGFFLTQLSRQ